MSGLRSVAIGAAVALTAAAGYCQDAKIVMDGSTTVGPIAKALAEYYMAGHPDVNITISESGSGNGAKSVINGTCDIGNMSRPMKASEIQAARDKGVNVMQHIVAMDGIAVAVHPANPVDNLTLEQVRKVYMGEITNWSELGGPNRKIVVISRDTNSGTYETFSELVMDKNKVTDKAEYVGSNGAIRQRILSTEGAIGYVGLAFLQGVKPLVIGGVEPTPENVIDGSYPISRPLSMYTNGEPAEDTHLGAFLSLYKTEEGRQIVEEQGFVPVP